MCLCQKRKLTYEEINLIKKSITENNDYIDDLYIYINTPLLNSLFNCCRPAIKSALTINHSIFFSFDPNFENDVDMILLLHELKHVEQCREFGYCCLIPRYLKEMYNYGYIGMYHKEGTLEFEADEFSKMAILKKYN